jgi:hypothetical protein
MGCPQVKKIEAFSSEQEHVYESDMYIWVVHIKPEGHPAKIQCEFDEHDRKAFSRARRGLESGENCGSQKIGWVDGDIRLCTG